MSLFSCSWVMCLIFYRAGIIVPDSVRSPSSRRYASCFYFNRLNTEAMLFFSINPQIIFLRHIGCTGYLLPVMSFPNARFFLMSWKACNFLKFNFSFESSNITRKVYWVHGTFFMFHEVMDAIDWLCKYLEKVTLFFIDLFDPIFSHAVLYCFHHLRLNSPFCSILAYCNQLKHFTSGVYWPHNRCIIG